MKEAVTKCKKGKKNQEKNRAQNKLGFRDTSTESSSFCQYLYTVRRGGRKTERLSLEGGEGEGERTKSNMVKQNVGRLEF